jgi:hypothetical protein
VGDGGETDGATEAGDAGRQRGGPAVAGEGRGQTATDVGLRARCHHHDRAGLAPQGGDEQRVGGQRRQRRRAQQQRDGGGGDAEGADVGLRHDLHARPVCHRREEAVGRVGQAVEVDGAGDGEVGGDGDGGRHHWRPRLAGRPPHGADGEADDRARRREPAVRGAVGWRAPHRHGRQERERGAEALHGSSNRNRRPATTR